MIFDHQELGAQWLAQRAAKIGGGYLADAMGLGKTRTLLRAVQIVGAKRPVVVCPANVRSHWAREAAEMGVELRRIMSYEEAVNGATALQRELDPDALISDEAHYCKNMDALRTRRIFGISGYSRDADYVFPASGTPMPKNPMELWPVLSNFPAVCKEHKLLNARVYKDRFCSKVLVTIGRRRVERILPVLKNEDEFRELLSKFMLRRLPDDVGVNIPKAFFQITDFDIDVPEGDGNTSEWRHAIGDAKVAPTIQMLRDFLDGNDAKIVVFAHHRSVLHALFKGLQPMICAYVDGDTTDVDAQITMFQHDPDCRVFIGQNIACQTGITLTAARRVVIVEPDWTHDVNVQLGHRVARIGQTAQHCIVQLVVASGTLDDAIVRRNHAEYELGVKAGLTDAA